MLMGTKYFIALTTDDNAELVYSETKEDGTVILYVEKPDIMDCLLHKETVFFPRFQ